LLVFTLCSPELALMRRSAVSFASARVASAT
jgi:hypothetical protein